MIAKIFLVLSFICCMQCEKFRYDNYSLYKIYHQNEKQINVLQELTSDVRFDFWSEPMKTSEHVMVLASPENKKHLEYILNENDMKFEIKLPNIQENIDKEATKTSTRLTTRNMQWDMYYSLDAINAWIDDLAARFPDVVTIIEGGTSYENRPIKGLRISHGSDRRIIFIEGGIHSREWIAPAVVNYITNELLTSTDEATMAAARDFDWYIFPVTNPDGYVWSHEEMRMWRKNRRPISGNIFGVDLNRNWDSDWMVHGSSDNPATDNYAGPYAFSEPESRSLSNYISSIGNRIDLYLSFHSYSELLLLPFGNSTGQYGNYQEAINIGRRAMGALSVRYGKLFTTGSIAEAIYLATGGSIDWVKSHENVPLVYCYELRDKGEYGFLLPPDQILPSGLETMDSVLELIYQAKRFGVMNPANNGNSVKFSMFMIVLVALTLLF